MKEYWNNNAYSIDTTFEDLFNVELTQEEIDSNGNVIGGADKMKELLEIFKDHPEPYDEEINENEQKPNNITFNEAKNIENRETKSKTSNNEIIKSPNMPEKKFLNRKRKDSSIHISNEKKNENSENQKENIKPKFKLKKQKEKNSPNDYSLVPEIKKFHTLFNIYFKYLIEGNSFDVSVFDKKGGPNGYYISKSFTQENLGAKVHYKKLDEKIKKFIQDNKLKKLEEKKDERVSSILNCTARELINMFYKYIFENFEYFKENKTITIINAKFNKIMKYPLIDLENGLKDENLDFGYFKYSSK